MKLSVLLEKTRSKTFSLREFLSIPDYQKERYTSHRLRELGRGSSRTVFVLTSNKVLKIASSGNPHYTDAGMAQNEAEVSVWTSPGIKEIVAAVHQAAQNYMWIISELVNPIKSISQINRYFGPAVFKSLENFEDLLLVASDDISPQQVIDEYAEIYYPIKDEHTKSKLMSWVSSLQEFTHKTGVGDFLRSEQFGLSSDGRLVILDYGFTEEVSTEFYGW